ncbi:MAG: MFS transporter [Polyangiales bacterium]
MARSSAFPLGLFAFAFLGWTFDFYDLVLLGFVKERVAHDLGLSHAAESWMLGVALGTSGLGGIVSGAIADRIGKRDVLAATVLIYSLGSLIAGLAPSFPIFLIGRGLVGLGVGGEWAIGHAMLAEAVRSSHRGRASAALQAGEPVGVALAAIAGFLLVPLVGWRWVMIGSSATAILAFAMRRSLHLPNEPAGRRPSFATLRAARVGKRMVLAWILGVFKLGTYWTCYTWLPTFLTKQMHQSIGRSLTWVMTAQIGQFTGMLTFGLVSDRLGRRPAFAMYSVLTACAIAPLAFSWHWLSDRPTLFWSAMFCLGLGSGCTAGFGALLAELFPSEVRGVAMGTTYNLARTVQLGAPVLVGWAVSRWDIAGGLGVPFCLALLTASWVWLLPETRGIELTKIGYGEDVTGGEKPASP